jgi:hypothetical protein
MNGDRPRSIESVFTPALIVDDITRDAEYRWLRGRQSTYGQLAGVGPLAANFSIITWKQITATPLQRLSILDRIVIRNSSAAAMGVYLGIILQQAIAGVTYTGTLQAPLDDRMATVTAAGPTTFGASHMGAGTNVARPTGADSLALISIPPGDTFTWDNPGIVLSGRNMLVVSGELVNTGFAVSLAWRERDVQLGEMS